MFIALYGDTEHRFPDEVAGLINVMQYEVLDALEQCLANLPRGGVPDPTQRGRDSLMRWFGRNDVTFAKKVAVKVSAMRMVLKNGCISLRWRPDQTFFGASNRVKDHPDGMMSGNQKQRVNAMNSLKPQSASYSIELTGKWKELPNYSTGAADTWTLQDKFQVLVHELSHSVLDTGDHGYGPVKCRALAIKKPNTAYRNAENWGYFIEEFC